MLTLCLYVYYTEKPAIKRYLLVLFCFICALMSKPMVVTLPLIMILLDYWPLGRFELQKGKTNLILWQLKEKLPFFVLSAVLIFITLYTPNNDISAKGFPLSSRLANAPVSFVTYLAKTFWPQDLAIFYPFPNQIPLGQVVAASLLTIFISAFVIAMIKCLPYLFVGWSWFAITIAPVIGILQISLTVPYAMADRYHYLPSIGIAMMLAWGIPSLLKNEETRKKILFPAVIASLAVLSVLTWQQCGYWKNSDTLFNHALLVTKNNYLAHNNLGLVLFAEGKTTEAIVHYNEAIRIMPDHVLIYNNRGAAYTKLGQYQLAIEDFSKAIRLEPDYADSYIKRGAVYLKQGHKESSCYDAQKACELGNCALLEVANNKRDCR